MKVCDIDGDGADEIAVSMNMGSGTGISIYELHILEILNDRFIDNKFLLEPGSDLSALGIDFKITKENDKTFLTLYNNSELEAVQDITEYGLTENDVKFSYGYIVEFNILENGEIEMNVAVGLDTVSEATIIYLFDVKASIKYEKDGGFSFKVKSITE